VAIAAQEAARHKARHAKLDEVQDTGVACLFGHDVVPHHALLVLRWVGLLRRWR
jgi:hypothetical protein